MKPHIARVIVIGSLMLGCSALGQEATDKSKQPPDTEAAYRKGGEIWRETTTRGILPADFQYLRDQTGWREAVLSYMRDGPGIFNATSDREEAINYRALMYVIERDGYEVTQAELTAISTLLDAGDRTAIKAYARLLRLRLAVEWIYAAGRMMQDVTEKDLRPAHRNFLLEALGQIETRLSNHLKERAENPSPIHSPFDEQHREAQVKLLKQSVAKIEAFRKEHGPSEVKTE